MMGERRMMQEALFYGFSLERHVPDSHMLRRIDRFVDLSEVRAHLGPYYSDVGRPSIDPELMIRMLIVGYGFGIRSERRLCEEVHLNLAYRWFCRLGIDGDVPDHSTFSKNRHGRFRESDLVRKLFETVVARCMKEGIVGGEAFAVDASMIVADAHRRRGVAKVEDLDPTSSRAVAEYLSVLDDAAFSGATPVEPKVISPTDPAARYTASANSVAGYAYSDNYLIDLKHAVIVDVEATTTIRQAEVGAAKTMLDRTAEQFDVTRRAWSPMGATARPRWLGGWKRERAARSSSRSTAARAIPGEACARLFHFVPRSRRDLRSKSSRAASIANSNDTFNEAARRAIADLYMLTTEAPEGLNPYAGIPWYSTVFGRDGLIAAMMMLWADPTVARGVLGHLAATQATEIDPTADAEPGKILHEARQGEMAELRRGAVSAVLRQRQFYPAFRHARGR